MTPSAPCSETLETARLRLAAVPAGGGLDVAVTAVVPSWLGDLVAEATARGVAVVVVPAAVPPSSEAETAGREIGLAAAALAAGAEVAGIDSRRRSRVAEVHQRWVGA